MAVASTAPIQIGRYRSPSTSLSRTIGWLLGSSTRTPTTLSSRTARLRVAVVAAPIGSPNRGPVLTCTVHARRALPFPNRMPLRAYDQTLKYPTGRWLAISDPTCRGARLGPVLRAGAAIGPAAHAPSPRPGPGPRDRAGAP